jgi:hypothetical protein
VIQVDFLLNILLVDPVRFVGNATTLDRARHGVRCLIYRGFLAYPEPILPDEMVLRICLSHGNKAHILPGISARS